MKTLFHKTHRVLSLLLALIMVLPMVIYVLPVPASAERYPVDSSNRYRITVYWNVVSANEKNDNNYFFVRVLIPVETDNTNIDGCYLSHKSFTKYHAADETGSHTYSFETCGYPEEIYYSCCGRAANPSEWYITKITIAVIDPVAGTGAATTYWEGKLGLRIASFGGDSSNYASIGFGPDGHDHHDWAHANIGTNQTLYTTQYLGNPTIYGMTDIEGSNEIAVPTDGTTATYTFKRGVVYDTLGAKWPVQGSYKGVVKEYYGEGYIYGSVCRRRWKSGSRRA